MSDLTMSWSLSTGLISRNDLLDKLQAKNIPFNEDIYEIIWGMPAMQDNRQLRDAVNEIYDAKFNLKLSHDHDDVVRNEGYINGLNKAIEIVKRYERDARNEKKDRPYNVYMWDHNRTDDRNNYICYRSVCSGVRTSDRKEGDSVFSGNSDTGSSED